MTLCEQCKEAAPPELIDPELGEVDLEKVAKQLMDQKAAVEQQPPSVMEIVNTRRAEVMQALGVPETPEGYADVNTGPLDPDTDLNALLHHFEFTPAQVGLVYYLAWEILEPVLEKVEREQAQKALNDRLISHYGSEDKWAEVERQLRQWAGRNLNNEVVDALMSSFEGVMTLQHMMESSEPGVMGLGAGQGDQLDEVKLREMMRDPRYWRDKDPAFVAQVAKGFESLYPA